MIIGIHLSAALASLALGPALLFLRKGTPLHKGLGRAWAALMLLTAISSFWILKNGQFSWIHILSVVVLANLACAVYFIRRGHVRAHMKFMVGNYLGLVAAGVGAVAAPGRTLHFFFFT
ncbi:MAG TPA: DUF2306 domain-containing protein [Burkholderiales bacterium]|nr:DUF2306 domain-containing protein [Burkholderiales bacterium]